MSHAATMPTRSRRGATGSGPAGLGATGLGATALGACALLVAVAIAPVARAQDTDPLTRACGDRRIEFRFDTLSLYVAPRWLAPRSLAPLASRFGATCPQQPVEMQLYLGPAMLDAAKTPAGLGRPFFFMLIDKAAGPSFDQGTRLLPADAPPARQTGEPYVEEVTQLAARVSPPKSPNVQVYRVSHPGVAGGFPSSVVVSCSGEARTTVGRQCTTPLPFRYRDDLMVTYTFQQDRLPFGSARPTDAGAQWEPDGVLAFDKAIRTWIDTLRAKP